MHELYIAECILDAVMKSLPEGIPPSRVQQVQVQVGELDAVVPETLLFLFDAIKVQRNMSSASLEIETVSVLCRCKNCGNRFTIEIPIFLCPVCEGNEVEILQGRGIQLTGITAEDSEGESDGNTGHS